MKSESVELRIMEAHSASVGRSAQPPARLAARGYTFTMAGGAQR
jgi:hypothetical protein